LDLQNYKFFQRLVIQLSGFKNAKIYIIMDRVSVIKNLADEIYDLLGPGCLESHYHDAFKMGFQLEGIQYESERILPVLFRGFATGQYLRMDLVVEKTLILELKSVKKITEESKQQLSRYMRVSGLGRGMLVNFGMGCVEVMYATMDGGRVTFSQDFSCPG